MNLNHPALAVLPPLLLAGALWHTDCTGAAVVQAWQQRYPVGQGTKILIDPSGNLIVAGCASRGMNVVDRFLIKYSAEGAGLWTNRWTGWGWGTSVYSEPNVAVDASGNIYVADFSSSPATLDDFVTMAYSSDGIALWTNRYNGAANLNDHPTAIAVGPCGYVVVTGCSQADQSASSLDYLTIAYSSTGSALWTNSFNRTGFPWNATDSPTAIDIDGDGTAFVAGVSQNSSPANYTIIAYSKQGTPLWTNTMWTDYITFPALLALDGAGSIYVGGTHWEGGYGHILTSYANDGTSQWMRRCGGYLCYAVARGMALDSNTNVFVSCSGSTGYRTFAYTRTGGFLWQRDISAPVGASDENPCAIAAGPDGTVYVAVSVTDDGTNHDYLTLAYSLAGDLLWTNRFNSSADLDDRARSVAVDAFGAVYVTGGSSLSPYGFYDALTFKLVPAPSIRFSNAELLPSGDCLLTIAAPTNTAFGLEASTNFSDWLRLTNFPPLPFQWIQYTEPQTPGSRFYRTIWSP